MATAAGGLQKVSGENGLFPGKGCLMGFGNFGCRALATMTDGAAPIAHIVRNRRMSAEWLRDGIIRQTGLRHALMAGGTAVHNFHSRNPGLINVGIVVSEQLLSVRPPLGIAHERPLVAL